MPTLSPGPSPLSWPHKLIFPGSQGQVPVLLCPSCCPHHPCPVELCHYSCLLFSLLQAFSSYHTLTSLLLGLCISELQPWRSTHHRVSSLLSFGHPAHIVLTGLSFSWDPSSSYSDSSWPQTPTRPPRTTRDCGCDFPTCSLNVITEDAILGCLLSPQALCNSY